jgi:hypothetical protein
MRELSLHLLDIAENSVAAGARDVTITVWENLVGDRLYLAVQDNGKGMDAELAKKVMDPFVTSRTTRKVGLGLPLLKEAAEFCNGYLRIQSCPGEGTLVEVEFQHSHIDRMPLGDLPGTYLTLLVSSPEIHWIFKYQVDDQTFIFDDAPVKAELEGVSLSEPGILAFLREMLTSGVASVQPIVS